MNADDYWLRTRAILTLAQIGGAVEAFNRGDVNVFQTLETIAAAIDGYNLAPQIRKDTAA